MCLLRCFNVQHYGGCIAIQQTDITPTINNPNTIKTAASLAAIQDQIKNNQNDIKTTIQNERMGADDTQKAVMVADALLVAHKFNTKDAGPPNTLAPAAGGIPAAPAAAPAPAAAAAPAPAAAKGGKGNGNGNAKGQGKGNGNGNAKGNGKGNGNGNAAPAAAAAAPAAAAAKAVVPAKLAMTNEVAVSALIQLADMEKNSGPKASLPSMGTAEVDGLIAGAMAAANNQPAAPAMPAMPAIRAARALFV